MKLMAHQLRGVQIAQRNPRFAFFHEPGCGKTIMVLAAVDDARARGWEGSTLVLAPKSILRTAWAGDAKHFPLLNATVVWHSRPAERRRLIADAPGSCLFVTNYETFKKHKDEFLAVGVRRLIVDESSKIKCPDSQISKAVAAFADRMDSVYILSGTPAPNNSTEYWSQMRAVDKGVFGGNFWRFAYHYFSPIKRTIEGRERVIGWKQNPQKEEDFLDRLRSRSWSLRKTECLDLPEQTDIVREVDLSPPELTAYLGMLQELRIEMGDGSFLTAAAQAKVMKLRQITAGAVYTEGKIFEIGRSKLDALREVLEEIGPRQVVVWGEFTSEINRAVGEIISLGRSIAVIDGSVPLEERSDAIEKFQAGALDVLVCHPAAAGHGITLTAASYCIYLSHSFSFETYQQSRDRIHRTGQTQHCTYYHLIAPGTIDERVWWALRQKKNGHNAVMELLGESPRRASPLVGGAA